MAVVVDGKVMSESERGKLNRLKVKGNTIKKKVNDFNIGTKIYFLGPKSEHFKLYVGKIIELLTDGKVKVLVMSRYVKDSDDLIEKIVDKNRLKLDNK